MTWLSINPHSEPAERKYQAAVFSDPDRGNDTGHFINAYQLGPIEDESMHRRAVELADQYNKAEALGIDISSLQDLD